MKLLLTLAALLLLLPVNAQQDSNVSLMIRFADGSNHFHIGEVIPIELSFSSSLSNTYDMDTRNYDHSGRLNSEQFHVMPYGRDPLHNFYSMGGFIGGGASSGPRVLSGEPQIIREDLNEWVALDKPGHFSLYVTSGRVGRRGTSQDENVELRSNSLEFDVVAADSAWQEQTFSSAVTILDTDSSTAEQKIAAVRTLRFLDTPESVQELVRRLGTSSVGGHWNEIAGLAGSRNQSLVVHELEQQLNAPDMGLTNDYLFILSKLKFQLEHESLPPYPEKDIQQQKIWREQLQARDKEFNESQDDLYEKAAALVASKSGTARTESVRMLLQHSLREPDDLHPIAGLPPEEVVSAFLNSSEDQQYDLLSSFWGRLKIPAMAGPLKELAEQPNLKKQWLRDLALRHLYELDPAEATPIFLEEIKHPHYNGRFTVKGETLGLLPNETMPQFDEILSARLAQKKSRTKELDAQLVARYSTKAVLPEVKNTYEASAGKWDCVEEDGFVLYFLRVDPDYGVKRLAVAPSFCMTNSLPAVIKMHRWSEVEPGVIARLNGKDLNRARQAAETLAKYGGPQAETALWERLRSFHALWAGRENEMVYRPGITHEASEASGFLFGIVHAIGTAQAWLLTDEEVTDLENVALGQERENVRQWHWSSPVDLVVYGYSQQVHATFNHDQFSAQDLESLRGKLAQYPKGTEFSLIIEGTPTLGAPALNVIKEVAAEHGFQVDSPQPIH